MSGSAQSKVYYTCGKCSATLFYRAGVVHEGTSGHNRDGLGVSNVKAAWGRRGDTALTTGVGGSCTSVFLAEAPDWMEIPEGNDGRICCPSCASRVGSFSWSGAPCSCGKWVTPAFQFQLSRIDPKGIFALPVPVSTLHQGTAEQGVDDAA